MKLTPGADAGASIQVLRDCKAEAVAWLEREAIDAVTLLNLTGTRRLPQALGVWPDLDVPELRGAIRATPYSDWPVIMLDAPEAVGYQDRHQHCPVRMTGEDFAAWRRRAAFTDQKTSGGSR